MAAIVDPLEARRLLVATDYDPRFGSAGEITPSTDALAIGIAVQSNGKLILASRVFEDASGYRLSRFNPADGTQDLSFGHNGVVTFSDNSYQDEDATSLAIDSHDRIVFVIGATVFRRTPSGAADTTFSGDGEALVPGSEFLKKLLVDHEDRPCILYDNSLIRLTQNGVIDTTFADAGDLLFSDEQHFGFAEDFAIDGADRPVFIFVEGDYRFPRRGVARLTTTGRIDTTFSDDGIFYFYRSPRAAGDAPFNAVGVGQDDSVLVSSRDGTRGWIARLHQDGSLDTTFGPSHPGRSADRLYFDTDFPDLHLTDATISRFASLSDRLLLSVRGNSGTALVELTLAGDLRTAFSVDGKITQLSDSSSFGRLAVAGDGSIFVVGTLIDYHNDDPDFSYVNYYLQVRKFFADGATDPLARITPNGTLFVYSTSDTVSNYISVKRSGETYVVRRNDDESVFPVAGVKRIAIDGQGGEDIISVAAAVPVRAGGGAGRDTFTADLSAADAYFLGGQGNDDATSTERGFTLTFDGGEGRDSLVSSVGADIFRGGAGYDTADYSSRKENLRVSLDGIANDGAPGEGDNISADVEAITGGEGSDRLSGNDANNTLVGGAGKDTIHGLGGDDSIRGDEGNDVVFGDDGHDRLDGADGRDRVFGGAGRDALFGGAGGDQLFGGDENDRLIDDAYFYPNEIDTLDGGSGSGDTVYDTGLLDVVTSVERRVTGY